MYGDIPKDKVVIETKGFSHGSQTGTSLTRLRNSIVNFDVAPIFNIPVAAGFSAYFVKDAQMLYAHWQKVRSRLDNYLYGTAKPADFAELATPKERFKDIVGREEIKKELSKIIEYIVHPDRYNRADIKISRGYLLAGSPQTGKTFMARHCLVKFLTHLNVLVHHKKYVFMGSVLIH